MTKRNALALILCFSILLVGATFSLAKALQKQKPVALNRGTVEGIFVNRNPEAVAMLPAVDNSTVMLNTTTATTNTAPVVTSTQPMTNVTKPKTNSTKTTNSPVINSNTTTKSTNTAPTNGTTATNSVSDSPARVDLTDPHKKDIAMQLVSSAENSSLNWRAQYAYIEDIGDGRGYTGGIIGFTSGTHDMLEVVQYYSQIAPNNILQKYISALQKVDGTSSHSGLDPTFVGDWKTAAADPKFQQAQDYERDLVYFNPAVSQAKADGLRALGQFIYYDALVMHGPGNDPLSFGGIRASAMSKAKTPAQGGNETTYLNAFLDARKTAMLAEAAHDDTSRVDTEQRVFLNAGNLDLNTPLTWKTYGDTYSIAR